VKGVPPEGEAPAQRVQERGHSEGEDEDDEEPPRELGECLADGAGADVDEEPEKERGAAEEEAEPDPPHQATGASARRAFSSICSILTRGTRSQAAAVMAVEISTSGT